MPTNNETFSSAYTWHWNRINERNRTKSHTTYLITLHIRCISNGRTPQRTRISLLNCSLNRAMNRCLSHVLCKHLNCHCWHVDMLTSLSIEPVIRTVIRFAKFNGFNTLSWGYSIIVHLRLWPFDWKKSPKYASKIVIASKIGVECVPENRWHFKTVKQNMHWTWLHLLRPKLCATFALS